MTGFNALDRRQSWLLPTLIFGVVLAVYLRTMAPSVFGLDSAELSLAAYKLGIVHAPGYPVYLMLAHVFTYRSWAVPILVAEYDKVENTTAAYNSLDWIDPDYLLVDDRMRAYFADSKSNDIPLQFKHWFEDHGVTKFYEVDDPTYGLIEVYRVDR